MTETEPTTGRHEAVSPRPRPVVEAARWAGTIAGGVGALAAGFGAYGAATHQTWAIATSATLGAVGAGLAKVLPWLQALGAEQQVTPLSDPRAADGVTRLVPEK